MNDRQRQGFLALNAVVMPVWLAMIVAPRSRVTARLVRMSTPLFAGLSAAYVAQLAAAAIQGSGGGLAQGDLRDPDRWRSLLTTPEGFLTGWTHFLVLDLFLGRWIWQTALAEGRRCRLALVLTLMAGPSGLLLFTLQRRLRPLP